MASDARAANWPVLGVLGVFFRLYWARAVCIPIMIGVLISYALSPLVDRLHRWHVPRALGAAVLLLGFLSSLGTLSYSLGDDEGYLLTPWLTGRASRMSPVAIFVGVLLWGRLWGVWGLLLGVPIIMIVKSICDRVEDLSPQASCSANDARPCHD